jgi:hypothetical protein
VRKTKRMRKREFLDEMNLVVPWVEPVSLIAPHAPAAGVKDGRPPFAVETMLCIHFLQHWCNLSDPAMEEALDDTPMFREFAGLDMGEDNLPDESTILRFRHLLEQNSNAGSHGLGLSRSRRWLCRELWCARAHHRGQRGHGRALRPCSSGWCGQSGPGRRCIRPHSQLHLQRVRLAARLTELLRCLRALHHQLHDAGGGAGYTDPMSTIVRATHCAVGGRRPGLWQAAEGLDPDVGGCDGTPWAPRLGPGRQDQGLAYQRSNHRSHAGRCAFAYRRNAQAPHGRGRGDQAQHFGAHLCRLAGSPARLPRDRHS